jgi:hypothetical protein
MGAAPDRVDVRGPRFGQALTGSLALAAFLLDQPLLVAGLAAVLGAGSVLGYRWNLWARIYRALVRPRLGPPPELEHPAPPRFATTLGFVFLTLGAVVLGPLAGIAAAWIGWSLVLAVAGLATFAAATDICVGCEIYVLLQRWRGAAEGVRT